MILSFLYGNMPDYCQKCSFYKPSKQIDWEPLLKRAKVEKSRHNLEIQPMKNQGNFKIRDALIHQYLVHAKGILHLGAHLGQERNRYAQLGKPVVWVEALPHIHTRLVQNLEPYADQQALCALLGDRNGVNKRFNISNNSEGVSSSIYSFGEYGSGDKSLWPEQKLDMIDSITLPTIRLDTLLLENGISFSNYDYWVVDLQGSELLGLKGTGDFLKHCNALYIEVSTVEVYQGGILWEELLAWLEQQGFMPLWQPDKPHDDILFIPKKKLNAVEKIFHSDHYLRHNQRRLEHLASLGLDLQGKRVFEVGAGIGDHTSFYLDRNCSLVVTDIRPENLELIRKRFADNSYVEVISMDINHPNYPGRTFDIIHCYGLLYHLQKPKQALKFLADHCTGILLLETCVSYGNLSEINPVQEPSHNHTQGFYGTGCRPTRQWIWDVLNSLFQYVYMPRTQPAHEEFPIDWTMEDDTKKLKRAVFVTSTQKINNPLLVNKILNRQDRC